MVQSQEEAYVNFKIAMRQGDTLRGVAGDLIL